MWASICTTISQSRIWLQFGGRAGRGPTNSQVLVVIWIWDFCQQTDVIFMSITLKVIEREGFLTFIGHDDMIK